MTSKGPHTWLITGADKGLSFSEAKAAHESGERAIVTCWLQTAVIRLRPQQQETV